jgi:DNA modification methylase
MIKPVYEKEGVTLYHAKCEEVLPQLIESEVRVDSVTTDPPFGIGYNYGEAHKDGKEDYGEGGYGKWLWGILEQCESLCNPGSPLFVWQAMPNVRKFSEWFPRDYRLFAACKNFPATYAHISMQHGWDPILVLVD